MFCRKRILIALALGWTAGAARADSTEVEHARYSVAAAAGGVEIRDYAPEIVAETSVAGEREAAINQGFRTIAGYIFGGNAPGGKIAMTAPVTQQGAGDVWKVRFVMPGGYTLKTLPRPNDPAVRLAAVPGKRYAAVAFSGAAGADELELHRRQLLAYLAQRKLKPRGQPVYAFYDPPWTPASSRRNEVLVEIAR
jgi:effector-binding domain-containing protein